MNSPPAPSALALIRPWLCLMSTATALAGYFISDPGAEGFPAFFGAGFFLLAAGASALNQVQERHSDALMGRTRRRPLPSSRLKTGTALAIALLLCILGLVLLALEGPLLLPIGGLVVLLIYNLVYTPLKKCTDLALIPGALVGAAPPLLGALAATGDWPPTAALMLAGLLFLWQFPHFWLLALRHSQDYRRAGLPNLGSLLTPRQFRRVLTAWLFSLSCLPLLFSALNLLRAPLALLIAAPAVLLPLGALWRIREEPDGRQTARLFGQTNLYMAFMLLALGLERLCRP